MSRSQARAGAVRSNDGRPDADVAVDDRGDGRLGNDAGVDARELASYLLSRPATSPRALFGGLVNHERHRIAQLRDLLKSDLATITRGLATLDELDHLNHRCDLTVDTPSTAA